MRRVVTALVIVCAVTLATAPASAQRRKAPARKKAAAKAAAVPPKTITPDLKCPSLIGMGVKTVRSAGSVARALALIDQQTPDFALLDVSLIREKSFAVAERLEALKIPFAFVTGYGADARLPAAFACKPRLPKPYSTDALQALLKNRGSKP